MCEESFLFRSKLCPVGGQDVLNENQNIVGAEKKEAQKGGGAFVVDSGGSVAMQYISSNKCSLYSRFQG
jgi:hypothetical protein